MEPAGWRAKAREQTELFTGVVYTRQTRTLLLFSLLPPSFSHSLRNSLRPMPLFWGELGAGSLVREKASGLQPAATRGASPSLAGCAHIAYISRVYMHTLCKFCHPGGGAFPADSCALILNRKTQRLLGGPSTGPSTGATPRSLAQIAAWHTGHVGCRPLAPAARSERLDRGWSRQW